MLKYIVRYILRTTFKKVERFVVRTINIKTQKWLQMYFIYIV